MAGRSFLTNISKRAGVAVFWGKIEVAEEGWWKWGWGEDIPPVVYTTFFN